MLPGIAPRPAAVASRKVCQSGASIILFTVVMCMVVVPIVGLAIDGSIVFWVKGKLAAAVDAAALAAGRNPSLAANTVAQQYVYANFPAGWLGTSFSVTPTAVVDYPSLATRRVTVSATVDVPLHFMGILGRKTSQVPAVASAVRRTTNLVLVLDRSGSMNLIDANGNKTCDVMKASAATFISNFADGQDNLALLTFHTWANLDFPISASFQSSTPNLTTILSDLTCGSNTSSAMALAMAYQVIQNLGSSAWAANGFLNVIVFFTDGNPNGVTAVFPAKDQADDRYYASPKYGGANVTDQMDIGMPATTSQCQSSMPTAPAGAIIQGANAAPTGVTQGVYQIYTSVTNPAAPTAVCASGQSRAICNTALTLLSPSGCYYPGGSVYTYKWPVKGQYAARQDVAYIPPADSYGNATNTTYMTQTSNPTDLVGGPYVATQGMRVDTPQAITHASFNAADSEALTIISDTHFKPVIYTIGLGGATDVASQSDFQNFLQRVANDPRSTRFNPMLQVGLSVYAPNDTQLQSAFHQIASQVLRLSK